jgi:hypothetical protein
VLAGQEFRKDSSHYHPSLFEWTHFRSKAKDGGLYLLLLVDHILKFKEFGTEKVRYLSNLKEAKAGKNNLSLEF